MDTELPIIYIARHGETAWSVSGLYTGLTDLPLTERGERNARRLGDRLKGIAFAEVFTSPLKRAFFTCELAGFSSVAKVESNLVEWDYGQYEGRRSIDILKDRPDWQLFKDGCPGGESPEQVVARADQVVKQVRQASGNVLIFSSGHLIRVFVARWLGLNPEILGRYLLLTTASLSAVGYEHNSSRPVIRFWNDTQHVGL